MSLTEKNSAVNLDQVLASANRRLPYDQQIQPDDPLRSLLVVNDELFKAYTEALQKAFEEAQLEMKALTRQEVEEARQLAGRMVDSAGNHLQTKVQEVGSGWESKAKEIVALELAKTHQANLFMQVFSGLILLGGGLAIGILIGNRLIP